MADKTELVRSHGIFHALPTYPDSAPYQNLTAIVTGANGISGFHMVKVLAAAPERWSKVYCLSRRPPPDYFFDELGEGAARVEHVEVDFLDTSGGIGKALKGKVSHVDHVFFFSFATTKQEGAVLGMWSDADALAKLNTDLIVNFAQGLKDAGLKPKRFLLQTGAKHYGFHIGPATNPSFETDTRVTLENNFYYPQEDALDAYCKEVGAQWNVVRPSYIIGAVRDNLLNHMVGFAVYGAVQAHLGEPIAFPGDYLAWDREYCQSEPSNPLPNRCCTPKADTITGTALLNAYLEEWAVLNPDAGNQAFNAQDGTPFTWSRFWPYLASWYGTDWTPPEDNPLKYRTTESRWTETPRGYGPRGVVRSTFSLCEWAAKPKVQAAWKQLAQQHNLQLDPFADIGKTFGITDSAVIGGWALSLSTRKARKMGFYGVVDSYESMFHCLQGLVRLKVSPPLAVGQFVEVVA